MIHVYGVLKKHIEVNNTMRCADIWCVGILLSDEDKYQASESIPVEERAWLVSLSCCIGGLETCGDVVLSVLQTHESWRFASRA